jgi:hypothetical protein
MDNDRYRARRNEIAQALAHMRADLAGAASRRGWRMDLGCYDLVLAIAGDDPEAARRAIVRLVPAGLLPAVVHQLLAEVVAQQPPSMVLGPEHPALERAMAEAGEALQQAGRLTQLPRRCTGVTARWCPICGDCSCPQAPEPPLPPADPRCPLHGDGSSHGELEADRG